MMEQFGMPQAPGGVCSVHGKNRSADVLVEDGYGGFMCARGKECKVAGQTKTIPCTFWQAGKCTKGDACSFAHVPAWGGGGGGCGEWEGNGKGAWGGNSWDMGGKGGGKPAMMAWMAKGMQMMMGKGKGFGKGKGPWQSGPAGGTFLCAVHGKMRSQNAVMEIGNGQYQCKPDSECKGGVGGVRTKTAMCKFFLEGRCAKGESCTFAHSQEEIGQQVPEGAATARFMPY
eukprot:CAMPEP_0181408668 /NCGR_PEP_ID=MMETSP1110-20121109/6419_1 /TAXON_ID=174948 /ORGANISM="Symbiodinium sp., Strain CCMP421" /LENGTH=228 /DNA_ID=CAMNT_0023531145 /DNA_START=52 /DNA_END=738 /DNA_ORIENTATION=-